MISTQLTADEKLVATIIDGELYLSECAKTEIWLNKIVDDFRQRFRDDYFPKVIYSIYDRREMFFNGGFAYRDDMPSSNYSLIKEFITTWIAKN